MKKTLLLTATLSAVATSTKAANEHLPNMILIYMDDLGYGDLTVTGAQGYTTPNLDRMSMEGMRFTQFYTPSPVSSASRAGLMTGCYPNRISIYGALMPGSKVGISSGETTIAEMLKTKGYKTCIVGKWHLGDAKEFLPLQHGFDEYFGLPYSNDMWPYGQKAKRGEKPVVSTKHPPLPLIEGNNVLRYIETLEEMDELTTLYTERSIDFIQRNRENPFFLYLPHAMVHTPLACSEKFRGKSEQGPFGDVMMEVDWSIGEILKALKEHDLEKNTLVIFTSDNGPWINFGMHAGSAASMREAKSVTFEGGQRVGCIMKWPAVIPNGVICNRLSSAIDIFPTLAEITGAPLPERKIDGVSILPLMKAVPDANPRQYFFYYFQNNKLNAVRDARFKLVEPHDYRTYEGFLPRDDGQGGQMGNAHTDWALYDLRRDPGERYDVQELYPDVVERLKKELEKMRADIGDSNTKTTGSGVRPSGSLK